MKRYLFLLCLGMLILASCGSVQQEITPETAVRIEETTSVTTNLPAEETSVSSLPSVTETSELTVTETSELRSGTVTAAEITEQ